MILELLLWIAGIVMIPIIGMLGEDHWVVGGIFVGAWTAILSAVSHVNPYTWLMSNPGLAIRYAIGYIVVGVAWSVIKTHMAASKIEEDDLVDSWSSLDSYQTQKRVAFENIFSKVPVWIAFWPFILVVDVIQDFLRSFFKWIAQSLRSLYNQIFELAISNMDVLAVSKLKNKTKDK